MARFTIYSSDGQTVRYTGTPVYHGTHLKVAYLEFKEICSPTPIPWSVGDYVDYSVIDGNGNETRTGFRYKLYSIPQPTKQATSGRSGESFVYNDVQFHCATKDLEICPFRDLVISDNTIHFTTLPDVATYEDVSGIARRIQENLNNFYGSGVWSVNVIATSDADLSALLSTVKEFSLSNGSCLGALDLIYSQWRGIGWVYSVVNGVNTITIGRPNVQDAGNTTSVFAYGLGNGITVLRKEQSDKNELATRIYAYGSTRNLIARYYNNLTPAIKDAASVYIPNLMIPPAYWGTTENKRDASKAYLEASPATRMKYGLRPKIVYFDGSGDYEEIYPSIEGMTTGELRAAMSPSDQYYPSTTVYPLGTERIDEVVARVNPSDNGVVGTATGEKYSASVTMVGIGSINHTEHVWKNQQEVNFDLGDLTESAVISTGGTVTFTPNIHGVIGFADADLGGLTLGVYLIIDGEVYKTFDVPLNKTAHSASIAPQEITCTIERGGTVVLRGYVEARPLNPSADFDVVLSATVGDTTLNVETTLADSFTVTTRQLGFDISKQQASISNGLCTISFKSGWCAGRDFVVKKSEYDAVNDAWVLTVARQSDDSIGQYFPNSIYRIEVGDRFVLTDLTMPEVYITTAQVRLYNRAAEVLANMSTPKMVYEPEIDAKVLTESPEVITEGMYMPIQDSDVIEGGEDWVLIDSIEIDEGADAIPTYKITLQDEKRENFFNRISKATGRNTRNIRSITTDGLRNSVETNEPDYEVSTKSFQVASSQFFVPVRDEELNATIGAKAIYDLYITQTEADEEEEIPEVIKNISDVLRHLSLQVYHEGQEDETLILQSDITFASLHNVVAGGLGGDGGGSAGGSLASLSDVSLGTLSNGDILKYDALTSHWVNTQLELSLGDLTNVAIGTPLDGQVLLFDSSMGKWRPGTVSGGGGSVDVVSRDATIGTALTEIATINNLPIRAKIANYLLASNFSAQNIVSTLGDTPVNRATADANGANIRTNYGANLIVSNNELVLMNGNNSRISTITAANIRQILGIASNDNIATTTWVNTYFATSQDVAGKVDKPTSYTNGNFASFDLNGNIKDSGCSDSSFVRSVTVSSESATIGTTLTKIATVQGVEIKAKIAEYLLASSFTASNIISTIGNSPVPCATADSSGNTFVDSYAASFSVSAQNERLYLMAKNGTTPLSYVTGANIVSVIGSNAVAKAIADASGNTITTSYLRKNIDDTMSGNLTIGASNSAKSLMVYGSGTFSTSLNVGTDASFGGNVTIGAQTSTTTAKALTIYGRNNSTNPALNIYGVASASSRYLSSLYVASDGLHITTALNVAGNIIATGNIVAGSASDRRLKKEIRTITRNEAADVLWALNPVTYQWNELAARLGDLRGVGRGFLADEFLDKLPNAGRKIWGEYDAIDYEQVIPYLVAGWKEQQRRIVELETELKVMRRALR